MKIYVVTNGCYSDYHIITATENKDIAEKIANKFEADIEEFNDAEIMLKPLYIVRFDGEGNVERISEMSNEEYAYMGIDKECVFEGAAVGALRVYVVADTAEAAVKIANEKRAMYLAQKKGIC